MRHFLCARFLGRSGTPDRNTWQVVYKLEKQREQERVTFRGIF